MIWSSDKMDVIKKSLYGNRYSQVFSNGIFFENIYPVDRKSDAVVLLKIFITEIGFPEHITIGGSKEQNTPIIYFINIYQRNNM